MQRFKQRLLLLLLLSFPPPTLQKPCGLIPILSGQKSLSPTDFLRAREEFVEEFNGRAFTLFGWIKPLTLPKTKTQLISVSTLQKTKEGNEEKIVNGSLFELIYERQSDGGLSFKAVIRKTVDGVEEVQLTLKDFTIGGNKEGDKGGIKGSEISNNLEDKDNEQDGDINTLEDNGKVDWVFVAFSIDFSQNTAVVHIGQETIRLETDYRNFLFGKNLEIDIGCKGHPNFDCFEGLIKDFSYTLDYFEHPEFLFVFNSKSSPDKFYVFDYKLDEGFSKDKEEFPYYVINKNKRKNKKDSNNKSLLQTRSEEIIHIPDAFVIDDDLVNSPTVYLKFKFFDGQSRNSQFLGFSDKKGKSQIEIRFIRDEEGGFLELMLPEPGLSFKTKQLFQPNELNTFSLSFIQVKNKLSLMIYKEGEKFFYPVDNFVLKGGFDIFVFNTGRDKGDIVEIKQFNILGSASGAVHGAYKNKFHSRNLKCSPHCDYFSSLAYKETRCVECNIDAILDPVDLTCQAYCKEGRKNVEDLCLTCSEQNCEELASDFFSVRPLNDFSVLLSRSHNLIGFDNNFADAFTVEADFEKIGGEFEYEMDSFQDGENALFRFSAKDSLEGKEVVFKLKRGVVVYDYNRNLAQGFEYPVILSRTVENRKTIKRENIKNTVPKKEEKEELGDKTNSLYSKLALFSCIVVYMTLGFGLLGVIICSSVTSKPSFLYQKFIQCFLVFQLMAIWSFYTDNTPTPIKDYFSFLYRHSLMTDLSGNPSIYPIAIFQMSVLILYLLLKIAKLTIKRSEKIDLGSLRRSRANFNCIDYIHDVIEKFEWAYLITTALLPIIGMTVHNTQILLKPEFINLSSTFYLLMSSLHQLVTALIVLYVLAYPLRPSIELVNSDNVRSNGFIFEGLRFSGAYKHFQGIQYLVFLLIAITIAMGGQLVFPLLLFFMLTVFVVFGRPALNNFDKIEQTIFFTLLFFTFSGFVYLTNKKQENNTSTFVLSILTIGGSVVVILINFLILGYKLIKFFLECLKAREYITKSHKSYNSEQRSERSPTRSGLDFSSKRLPYNVLHTEKGIKLVQNESRLITQHKTNKQSDFQSEAFSKRSERDSVARSDLQQPKKKTLFNEFSFKDKETRSSRNIVSKPNSRNNSDRSIKSRMTVDSKVSNKTVNSKLKALGNLDAAYKVSPTKDDTPKRKDSRFKVDFQEKKKEEEKGNWYAQFGNDSKMTERFSNQRK